MLVLFMQQKSSVSRPHFQHDLSPVPDNFLSSHTTAIPGLVRDFQLFSVSVSPRILIGGLHLAVNDSPSDDILT